MILLQAIEEHGKYTNCTSELNPACAKMEALSGAALRPTNIMEASKRLAEMVLYTMSPLNPVITTFK
jgi:hypothetical protein